MRTIEQTINQDLQDILLGLDTPAHIQDFLDTCAYVPEYDNRSPSRVLTERRAHCLDGGCFAAAALRRLGYPPLLVDIFPDPGVDDDHVLAVYQLNGAYGALAKSNFVGLRSREPVYRTVRELVMTYFEQYYNLNGIKSLRTYTMPVDLSRYDRSEWETEDTGVDAIERVLLSRKRFPLITPAQIASLSPVDDLTYRAGMLVANMEGIYKPKA